MHDLSNSMTDALGGLNRNLVGSLQEGVRKVCGVGLGCHPQSELFMDHKAVSIYKLKGFSSVPFADAYIRHSI